MGAASGSDQLLEGAAGTPGQRWMVWWGVGPTSCCSLLRHTEGSTAFPFSTGLGHFSPPGQTPPRSTGTRCPHTFGPICSCGASKPQYGETGPLLPMAGWARQALAGVCAADLRSTRHPPWTRLGRSGSCMPEQWGPALRLCPQTACASTSSSCCERARLISFSDNT